MTGSIFRLVLLAVLFGVAAAALFSVRTVAGSKGRKTGSSTPELEYLKVVNQAGPPQDPQLLFLLMAAFASAGQQSQGVDFLTARLHEFDSRLSGEQKSLYLSAIAVLRAQHATSVPLYSRIGYVKDTIALLDQAKKISRGQIFVVNWISGVVRAQFPSFFHQRSVASNDLKWCEANISKAPNPGWLREVDFQLARLAKDNDDRAAAQDYLKRSGYSSFDKPIVLTTPFSEDPVSGHRFSPRQIKEVVPGRVYALSGFDFTEYYFVVSEDKRHLIGIDAGTTAEAAKTAYEALRSYAPGLPPLTTIFITHSHWDHIGGHRFFQGLDPKPTIIARSNYHEEIASEVNQPPSISRSFFGEHFKMEDVRDFKPDVTIEHEERLNIGGTRIELVPIHGGETQDGMFIYLPNLKVMFVGDFIMPYIGAPFVPEGSLQGLSDAIDLVVEKHPRFLLHGHEPLTAIFSSPEILGQIKLDMSWLRQQVLDAIAKGESRSKVQDANLIPPDLLQGRPDVLLPYMVLREHVIDRLFQQNVGYWQADLTGVDHLDSSDRAAALVDYFGLSEKQIVRAANRMIADGRYELAASLLDSAGTRFGHTEGIAAAERLAYLKLMEKYQNTDPFKYILYSAKTAERTPAMDAR